MPFFMAQGRLVYYAHVPKCGGSSIASYIRERFGPLAFHLNRYLDIPPAQRWMKSSPQHVDSHTLERLIPLSFFSSIFTIVRHPVDRAISTYHFQHEVERSIPEEQGFEDWLQGLVNADGKDPFRYDNHVRPMAEIVPEGATVFHMEHGLDGLIPWFDALTGTQDGPRAILPENKRGDFRRPIGGRVSPSPDAIALLTQLYKVDCDRFGYEIGRKQPLAAAPVIDAAFLAERDRALNAAQRPLRVLRRKLQRKASRFLG